MPPSAATPTTRCTRCPARTSPACATLSPPSARSSRVCSAADLQLQGDSKMTSALAVIRDEVYGLRTAFESVVCDTSIAFEREARFAMQIMEGNDFLADIAVSNKPSLRAAITNIAAIGISLNPANKQAYLVPRDKKVCLDISYMGLLDLATNAGSI